MPGLALPGLQMYARGVAPDGCRVAYSNIVADISARDTAGTMKRVNGAGTVDLFWSPQSNRLAEIGAASTGYAENGGLKAWVVDLATTR